MKPQQQLRKEPNGDCLRACIATLLEHHIASVPDFVLAEAHENDLHPAWWLSLQTWLAQRGMFFLEMVLTDKTPLMPLPLPAMCIAMGDTDKGVRHAVVARIEEAQIIQVYNPWSGTTLTGIGSLGFLIPRDPVMPIKLGKTLERIGQIAVAMPATAHSDSIRHEVADALNLNVVNGAKIIAAAFAPQQEPNGQN